MKTKEEIEQLAKDFADDAHGSPTATFLEKGFIKGYTQCQEDMSDKKYTESDLRKVIDETIDACNIAQRESYGELEIDVDKIINSLNKTNKII